MKIFNDPIHGHIAVSDICVKIIDTPQFQRLRDISQLGGVYYVFSGASSKRFEHCIGVSYLAKLFVEQLRERQPELDITNEDVLCVEIAGLCHDLGHGPFSHLFDGKFLPAMGVTNFVHEHASVALLDLLIEENNLWPELQKCNIDEKDVHFIKELILGDEHEAPPGFVWTGRTNKEFLFDIVANKRNGIDVDKFDYFARDCHVLGVTKSFDCLRLMQFARVFQKSDQRLQSSKFSRILVPDGGAEPVSHRAARGNEICFHVKEAWNLFELFHTRYTLHKRAYQHRVSNAVELMTAEVLKLANPFLFLPGKDGKPTKMSECPNDMHAYWRLGEYLLKQIENSFESNLNPAKEMILRIRTRDLFCFVGETLLPANEYNSSVSKTMHAEIMNLIQSHDVNNNNHTDRDSSMGIESNDVFCSVVRMGYGKGGKNPVTELTTFYQPNRAEKSQAFEISAKVGEKRFSDRLSSSEWAVGLIPSDSVSRLIPREFEEIYVRIFCRYSGQKVIVDRAFDQWCTSKKNGASMPKK